ncbi:anthranilate phosphoribosyltransferase [Rothia amarae]|uniref:anthranilate phosphoribosyltransferase n=1 Tax=Rothia amarae TaxID=169480 RepID=UPI001EE3F1E9|nr:anthranilate phosphoribosyltransferase [Rothia amarae]
MSISEISNPAISWKAILNKLTLRHDLSEQEIGWAMDEIMNGVVSEAIIGAFLIALHVKGESPEELSALAQGMLDKAEKIEISSNAVDIVGTGGDQHNTVNISTMASMVIVGAGVPVIKHGNRASSSSSGSADVLEKLGINLNMPISDIIQCLETVGIAFLFAQVFHPSMKHVAPTRKQLGVPTAFNYLGPMTNPAQVRSSAIGVADEAMARKIADVFASRNDHALIFRGGDGLDELTITCNSQLWEVYEGAVTAHVIDPREFGFNLGTLEDLRGGTASENAEVFERIMAGESGHIRNAVLLNAAAGIVAFEPVGEGQSFNERFVAALDRAIASLDNGRARKVLENWREFSQTTAN